MINGIINIYKEKGYTSHDVVARLRGICKQKKIGHTGTLDPDAQGVLPVCFGSATRLCEMLTEKEKEYIATMQLGLTTDTQDSSGIVLERRDVAVSEIEIRNVIAGFCGIQKQIPPMYSAIKVNGKKLYELARAGIEIERVPREITIHKIEILSVEQCEIKMKVSCSKGTYIRTLCHDIGQALGCGAIMTELCRTRSGQFGLEEALLLSQIEQFVQEGTIDQHCITTEEVFALLSPVYMKEEFNRLLHNGNNFQALCIQGESESDDLQEVRAYDSLGNFWGIYQYCELSDCYKPVKMFPQS